MSDGKNLTTAASTSLSQLQQKQFETVHCLLLPMHKEIALLPNAAVAEVVPYIKPEPVPGAPDWLLGYISWREHRVPFVSFERVSEGESIEAHKSCRIAVLNTLNGNAQLPYVAILMQGLPSLQVVRPNTIQFNEETQNARQSVKAQVVVNGTTTLVPDIDELEARILKLQA